jgi:glycosyltransferase involved in cell wall biosynthesis
MKVGVDGRSLAGHRRGVGQHTAGMLGALRALGVDLKVLVPRRRQGRPRLDRKLAPVDVLWLPAPAPVAVGSGTPYVLTVHDLSFLERRQDFTRYERLWHRLARIDALVRGAAAVVAPTGDTARRAATHFGVNVSVVPGGPGDPGPAADPATMRGRFGRYFLYIGALEPRKALDRLVAAGREHTLVLAGEGRLADSLRGPGVHLLGRVTAAEKAALYAGALAVVLPSWGEGYGYPPLEGFAHGTPAIVSDIPALRETAGDGALYVPPGDVAALAGAMRAVAGDETLRARLAAGGRTALQGRSWDSAGRALRGVLEAAA